MIFSIRRPQYLISHTKSLQLLVAWHRLSCEKVNLHKTFLAWGACDFPRQNKQPWIYQKFMKQFFICVHGLFTSNFCCPCTITQSVLKRVLSLKLKQVFFFTRFFDGWSLENLHKGVASFFFPWINILSLKIPYFDNIFLQNKNSMATLRD